MMPFGGRYRSAAPAVVTATEMQQRIEAELGQLTPGNNGKLDGDARIFKLPNAKGELGFISSVTEPF